MKTTTKLLLISIPSSIGLGMAISPRTIAQPQPKTDGLPKEWKVQSIAAPKIVPLTPHQALIAQQKLKSRNFYCDCYSCRLAAAQRGITLN